MRTIVAPASPKTIARAAEIIRSGGLVAFPTETVYGLGANALDSRAVAKIYAAKRRALNDPLIVHVAAPSAPTPAAETAGWNTDAWVGALAMPAQQFIDALRAEGIIGKLSNRQQSLAEKLIARFWPGPLTLVLPRGARVPLNVSSGLDTVAVRMPDHPFAQSLLHAGGLPIAAPSANLFGHVSPTMAQHVLDDLDGRIDMLLDGGPTRIGMESTVLDLTSDSPHMLRPGGITRAQLNDSLSLDIGEGVTNSSKLKLSSPGMLDKHYAPSAQLVVCLDLDDLITRQASLVTHHSRAGVLVRDSERARCADIHPQFVLGDTMIDVARSLYAGLRALDETGVDVILMTDVPHEGIGEAIADRLKRAAGGFEQEARVGE